MKKLLTIIILGLSISSITQAAVVAIPVNQGGTGVQTFGQGWLYSSGGINNLNSSTSPTVNYIVATSTTATSTFANGINITKGCFAFGGSCISLTSIATFGYPFPNAATTTLLTFSGGLISPASTTIGDGGQTSGLTISGGATTTGDSYLLGNVTIGTTGSGDSVTQFGPASNEWSLGYDDTNKSFVLSSSTSLGTNDIVSVTKNGRITVSFASTTALSATNICLSTDCRTVWPTGGGSGSYPFTPLTNYGGLNQATTGIAWFQTGLNASSTSHFDFASTTQLSIGNNFITNIAGSGLSLSSAGVLSSQFSYPFTPTTNFGAAAQATTGIAWFQNGLQASSTSYFGTGSTSSRFASNGDLYIGTSIQPQLDGFGTKNYEFQIMGDINDVVGGQIYNKSTGSTAASGLFFSNNKSPLGGIGALQTYYGGMVFGGGNWNGVPLGLGALGANDLGVYSTDGNLILASATTSANPTTSGVKFYTGLGSFSGGTPDAILNQNGNFGIATSAPGTPLSVTGAGVFTGQVTAPNFFATSTTATSTFKGPFVVNVGSGDGGIFLNPSNGWKIQPNQSSGGTGNPFLIQGQSGNAGGNNGGELTIQGGLASASSVGGNLILNGGTKGSGGTQGNVLIANTKDGTKVGVSTSSPYRKLSVAGDLVVDDNILTSYITATSTVATSTISGPLKLGSTGSSPTVGNAILVGGTVTVTTGAATTNSYLLVTRKTSGGTLGTAITYTVTNGSFTITSDSALDTSTFTWLLIN